MAKELEKTHTRRIIALILCMVIIFMFGVVRVFQYQIVNGEAYLKQAQASTETAVSITAARGEILDRNGVPLTQNKAAFNLEFDYTRMQKRSGSKSSLNNDAANETISKLIKAFEALGEEWLDELPITRTEPYEFKTDATEAEMNRLRTNLSLNDYATAQDCIYWLYQEYGIKKYKVDGNCTHCGKAFDECEYVDYDEAMARKIAGVRYQMLLKDFSYTDGHTRFTFAEDIKPDSVAWLREQSKEFPGSTITEKSVRTYISGDVGASLIGSMGPIYAGEYYEVYQPKGYQMNDIVGRSGIESAMEDVLRGVNGTMGVVQNNRGEVTSTTEIKTPEAGKTVQLCLDYYFQKELQSILKEYIEYYNANKKAGARESQSGSIVVLDAKTGGVIASVSYPYYDINGSYNELIKLDGNPMFNRALQGTYRPGSTFKPVVAAGGLAEGITTPTSTIQCTYVYDYYPAPFRPACLMDGHRSGSLQNVTTALQHSCNIYFYDVGRRLTIEKMNEYASLFGLGTDTGLEIANAKGTLTQRSDANWQEGNVVQAAIGQMNNAVTPLQMAIEAMTLANKGTRYNAHLVKSILSYDGTKVIENKEPVVASSFELGEENFNAMKEGMVLVSQSLKAPFQVDDFGYRVAMKTGTPQATETRYNSAAVGFAPADAPEIAFSIYLEETDNSTYTAKRLVRKILLAWEKAKANPGVDLSTLTPVEPEAGTSSGATVSGGTVSSGATSSGTTSSGTASEGTNAGNPASYNAESGNGAGNSSEPPVNPVGEIADENMENVLGPGGP